MASSNAVTSSAALTELKNDLTNLSATLHDIFELMSADMSQVGQTWQDGKYQEFVDNYKPQIQKCEDISIRYKNWCTKVLDPTIENVMNVERTDVGSGSSYSTGTTSRDAAGTRNTAGMVGGGVAAAMVGGAGIASGFNMVRGNVPFKNGQNHPIDNTDSSIDENFLGKKNTSSVSSESTNKGKISYLWPKSKKTSPHKTSHGVTNKADSVVKNKIDTAAAIEKNNEELAIKLGKPKGEPMTTEEADKQNANPHRINKFLVDPEGDYIDSKGIKYRKNPEYNEDENYEQYKVNCATCAAAYALRLRGHDVKAKGNPKEDGNMNYWLSQQHSFDIWNNADGTKAKPTLYNDYMKKKGIRKMSSNDYKNFFEEECKEKGVYIVTVGWEAGGGHATILQKDDKGLHYIEPQVFDSTKTEDGRRSLNDLVNHMASIQDGKKGIMRVDDKLFNVKYADLFEV